MVFLEVFLVVYFEVFLVVFLEVFLLPAGPTQGLLALASWPEAASLRAVCPPPLSWSCRKRRSCPNYFWPLLNHRDTWRLDCTVNFWPLWNQPAVWMFWGEGNVLANCSFFKGITWYKKMERGYEKDNIWHNLFVNCKHFSLFLPATTQPSKTKLKTNPYCHRPHHPTQSKAELPFSSSPHFGS